MGIEPKRERCGVFERRLEKFDQIVPKGAEIERLATGFRFTEGPVWNFQRLSTLQRYSCQPDKEVVAGGGGYYVS